MLNTTWSIDWSRGSSPGSLASHDHQRSVSIPAVENTIASKEIQNPSDALEILAQVAGDVQPGNSSAIHAMNNQDNNLASVMKMNQESQALQDFPPISNGLLNLVIIHRLLAV